MDPRGSRPRPAGTRFFMLPLLGAIQVLCAALTLLGVAVPTVLLLWFGMKISDGLAAREQQLERDRDIAQGNRDCATVA